MGHCPSCATQLSGSPKFCPECGTKLDVPAVPPREARKVVTVLFSDVAGSTALGERLDPEAVRTLMRRYFAAMQSVIERHGGTVEKFIGDAIMAVFGIPVLHEDDALRAVRAAEQMRDALAALNVELAAERGVTIQTRSGITTGEVVAGDGETGQTLVTGDTVNTAARLEQAAAPGEILIGMPTWRLVRDAVVAEPVADVDAKGKALPVPAYRLMNVAAGVEGHLRRMDAPLVGRERELRMLSDAWTRAREERSPQLFTLLGAAGVGKSRLVGEFLTGLADQAKVLRGRCLPYGEGITYWPLAEALRAGAGIVDADDSASAQRKLLGMLDGERDAELLAARLATAIGLSQEAAPQAEMFWAVRRTFEHFARQQPTVVVFEDIHWAEPTFLELLDHLAEWSRDVPLFLLAPARPELLDARPDWGGGKLNATTVLLEALPAEATGRLIDALPGGLALPAGLRGRITAAAEGNPLFVEELLAMLVDDGVLQLLDGQWSAVGDLEHLTIPPTIQALLAARLDRLTSGERRVAERASVVGRVFEPEAVAALTPEIMPVTPELMALVRKELVRPDRSEVTGGDAFKFRHILIRDAAYDSVPKRERAELHGRFAGWLQRVTGERADEFAEVIAFHLEQSVRYGRAVGTSPDPEPAVRAAEWLRKAATLADRRGDVSGTRNFHRRALELEPLPAERSREALPRFIDTLIHGADFEEARRWIEEGRRTGQATRDERLSAWCALLASRLDAYERSQPADALDDKQLELLGEAFLAKGDHLGVAAVEADRAGAAWGLGQVSLAADRYARAAKHASLAGHDELAQRHRAERVAALAAGAAPASEVLRIATSEEPRLTGLAPAILRLTQAECEASLGFINEAREHADEARMMLIEHGHELIAEVAIQARAYIEVTADRQDIAAELLNASCAALSAMGERAYFSTSVGLLANLLCDLRDYSAALERSIESEQSSHPSDLLTEALWRLARGRSVAGLGEAPAGSAWPLVTKALEIVEGTEFLGFRAFLLEGAADFAQEIRDHMKAVAYLEEARALYRQRESQVEVRRVEEQLAMLSTAGAHADDGRTTEGDPETAGST